MTGDKKKQILRILKRQALVVTGQDNKMDVVVQSRKIFCKFGCYGRNYIEAFNFCVQFTKDVKSVKEFKETTRYLFLLLFLGPFSLVFLLPDATPRS